MGDARFEPAYERLAQAPNRAAALESMSDAALVHALAAASRKQDPYVSNILATAVLNRMRRARALLWSLGASVMFLTVTYLLTQAMFVARDKDHSDIQQFVAFMLVLTLGIIVGTATYILALDPIARRISVARARRVSRLFRQG